MARPLVPIAVLLVALALMSGCSKWEMGPAQQRGAALLVSDPAGDRLLVLVQRSERDAYKSRGAGPGARQHLELHALALDSLEPLWQRRLATWSSEHDGSEGARMVAPDGDRVWVFLREIAAVSAADGSVVADAARVAAENPALAGRLPAEARGYEWHDGLVVAATDGTRHRIAPGGLRAEPWTKPEPKRPRDETEYQEMQTQYALAATTRGREAFQIAGGAIGDGWLGVLDPEEAKSFSHYGVMPAQRRDDAAVRRFHAARRSGARWIEVAPIGAGGSFVRAGLLRASGGLAPIALEAPAGALLLHQPGAELRLARVDAQASEQWEIALPLGEIEEVHAGQTSIALIGLTPIPEGGDADPERLLVSIDTATGAQRVRPLASLSPAAAPGAP
jgi:hypothetical protein